MKEVDNLLGISFVNCEMAGEVFGFCLFYGGKFHDGYCELDVVELVIINL